MEEGYVDDVGRLCRRAKTPPTLNQKANLSVYLPRVLELAFHGAQEPN